jgi:hypothetical protein
MQLILLETNQQIIPFIFLVISTNLQLNVITMSYPTKMEVSHDPRGIDQGSRSSTRIYEKQQGGQAKRHEDLQAKSSFSSKGSKYPKIFKDNHLLRSKH